VKKIDKKEIKKELEKNEGLKRGGSPAKLDTEKYK